MSFTVEKIRLHGVEYVLTEGGAIVTLADYLEGAVSYAHLFRGSGVIWRFNKRIGVAADIEHLGEATVELGLDFAAGFIDGILDGDWDRPTPESAVSPAEGTTPAP